MTLLDFSGIMWTITWKGRQPSMIPGFQPDPAELRAESGRESFFAPWLTGPWRPAGFLFAIMVAIATYRSWGPQGKWRITSLTQLIRQMRFSLGRDPELRRFLAEHPRLSRKQVISRLLVSFWAEVLGLTILALCQRLADPQDPLYSLRTAFGLDGPCHPQRVSELHAVWGGADRVRCHLRDLVCKLLYLSDFTEQDVERAAVNQTFDAPLLRAGQGYGFDCFLNYLFWQGIFACLEAALAEPLAANGFKLHDLVVAYCERLAESIHTLDDLATELRNEQWAGMLERRIAPVSQTFANFLGKLQVGCLVQVQEKQVRRAHRGRTWFSVAIDACILELFGDYEGARPLWDHVTHQKVKGYKLQVILSIATGLPVAFCLQEKEDTDADVLNQLLTEARRVLGVKRLNLVMFDRGYWRLDEFKALDRNREGLITPAKKYQTIQQAVAAIPRTRWQRGQFNEKWAETSVLFGEQNLRLRLVVRKKLGWRVKRDENKKLVLNEAGKPVKEPVILYHGYLTNLSREELDSDQVLATYSQRWGIEDFFEELLNQYDLRKFPGADSTSVHRHILLTFLLYTMVRLFRTLAAEWMDGAQYATMELRRFGKEFLRSPLILLRWLRQGKPPGQAPRNPRSGGVMPVGLFGLGSPS